jgi:pimeloyl-ACP methyl ester carboxylesterase
MPNEYVLVHGACHGAWCWDRLTPELEARGHRVVAVDLPTEDRSAGNVRYAEIVAESLAGLDEDVVVVGHSLAGLTIPLVAAVRPVRRLVFLCAFPAQPGQSFSSQQHPDGLLPWVEGISSSPAYGADGTFTFPPAFAAEVLYPDCSAQDLAWATARLGRQTTTPSNEVCPLDDWPSVPETRYVLARDDRAVNPAWARWVARERLGVDPVELPGGHCPFLARPRDLADILTSSP